MKIKSFFQAIPDLLICGIGDDGLVYIWDTEEGKWKLHKK